MACKTWVVGFILVYFIILIHLSLKTEASQISGRSNSVSFHSRWKRQLPFLSSWFGGSHSTSKPELKRSRYQQQNHYTRKNSRNSYVLSKYDKLPSYHQNQSSNSHENQVAERDPRCEKKCILRWSIF